MGVLLTFSGWDWFFMVAAPIALIYLVVMMRRRPAETEEESKDKGFLGSLLDTIFSIFTR